uniref:IlGF domain-containing protein n=1 Tax=Panagrellus redivivus TaxID=6233 RepID=A0A7E4VJ07_PANRE
MLCSPTTSSSSFTNNLQPAQKSILSLSSRQSKYIKAATIAMLLLIAVPMPTNANIVACGKVLISEIKAVCDVTDCSRRARDIGLLGLSEEDLSAEPVALISECCTGKCSRDLLEAYCCSDNTLLKIPQIRAGRHHITAPKKLHRIDDNSFEDLGY